MFGLNVPLDLCLHSTQDIVNVGNSDVSIPSPDGCFEPQFGHSG